MKTLHLCVTMPDQSIRAVPANVVAVNRAMYYANKEFRETGSNEAARLVRSKEYDYAMLHDHDALIDWAQNNMLWSDVACHSREIKSAPPVNYQEGWVNGKMEATML